MVQWSGNELPFNGIFQYCCAHPALMNLAFVMLLARVSRLLTLYFPQELEFDEFAPELTAFLENYRELEKNKKNAKAKAAAERAKEATGEEKTSTTEETKADESNKTDADGDASMGGQDEDEEEDDEEGGTATEAAATTAEKNEGEEAGEEDASTEEAKAMEE